VRLAEAFQCTLAVEAGNAAEAAFEVDFVVRASRASKRRKEVSS
jgi:hypothetical protein